jgi:glycosyltransferase involved in cell wall biosynthesis
MNILHFCWEYPPRGSGVGKYFGEISAGLRKMGHRTIIVTSRGEDLPEEELLEGGKIYRIYDNSEIGKPEIAERVLSLARKHNVDLIESADRLGEAAGLIKMKQRPPVMINCRYNDVVLRARYSQAWYFWQKLAIDLACLREFRRMRRERYSIEHADLLAAPSSWMLEALRSQGVRLPASNAVLPKPLAPLRNWTNNEADKPTLLLVARLDFGKGMLFLRDILARIARRFPDVCLEIAGGDSYARFIGSTRAWTERHLKNQRFRVRFLGQLSPSQLDDAYRRAWVVIIPSRWDTSPTVLLEAMVRAKPVVVSPYGGMAEYLGDDQRLIAEPEQAEFANAICSLLEDRSLRCMIGENLQSRAADNYSPEQAAKRYVDFVQNALESM